MKFLSQRQRSIRLDKNEGRQTAEQNIAETQGCTGYIMLKTVRIEQGCQKYLACTVVLHGKFADHFFSVLRSILHGLHTRRLLRGSSFKHGREQRRCHGVLLEVSHHLRAGFRGNFVFRKDSVRIAREALYRANGVQEQHSGLKCVEDEVAFVEVAGIDFLGDSSGIRVVRRDLPFTFQINKSVSSGREHGVSISSNLYHSIKPCPPPRGGVHTLP